MASSAKRHGPLRTPMADGHICKGTMKPSTAANTTVPGTAPKAAPIRSPHSGTVIKTKSK